MTQVWLLEAFGQVNNPEPSQSKTATPQMLGHEQLSQVQFVSSAQVNGQSQRLSSTKSPSISQALSGQENLGSVLVPVPKQLMLLASFRPPQKFGHPTPATTFSVLLTKSAPQLSQLCAISSEQLMGQSQKSSLTKAFLRAMQQRDSLAQQKRSFAEKFGGNPW